jgi:hypothetical protein
VGDADVLNDAVSSDAGSSGGAIAENDLGGARAVSGVCGVHAGKARSEIDAGDGGAVEVVEGAGWIPQSYGGGMGVVVGHGSGLGPGGEVYHLRGSHGDCPSWHGRIDDGLGRVHLDLGRFGYVWRLHHNDSGKLHFDFGDIGKNGRRGRRGRDELWLDRLDLLGDDRLGESCEQMAVVDRLFGGSADDNEDEQNSYIDHHGDEE